MKDRGLKRLSYRTKSMSHELPLSPFFLVLAGCGALSIYKELRGKEGDWLKGITPGKKFADIEWPLSHSSFILAG